MAKKILLAGMLVMVLAFGMTMAGCKIDADPNAGNPENNNNNGENNTGGNNNSGGDNTGNVNFTGDTALNGIWVCDDMVSGEKKGTRELNFNNGIYIYSYSETLYEKGIYTTNAGKITMTTTDLHGDYLELEESRWYSKNEILEIYGASEGSDDFFAPKKIGYSVTGNELNIGQVYTKK